MPPFPAFAASFIIREKIKHGAHGRQQKAVGVKHADGLRLILHPTLLPEGNSLRKSIDALTPQEKHADIPDGARLRRQGPLLGRHRLGLAGKGKLHLHHGAPVRLLPA